MTEPVQLTIGGDSEPLPAPEATASSWEASPLFAAPQTIRGQLAIADASLAARHDRSTVVS